MRGDDTDVEDGLAHLLLTLALRIVSEITRNPTIVLPSKLKVHEKL